MRESTAHAAAQFLSTLSLRRATAGQCAGVPGADHFYPRSPCGERLTNANSPKSDNIISIHALLAESDTASSILMVAPSNFYPRSPCGERLGRLMLVMALSDFYPRSPCGEQRKTQRNPTKPRDFYPRSPCGERHMDNLFRISYRNISIHALLAESDGTACPA